MRSLAAGLLLCAAASTVVAQHDGVDGPFGDGAKDEPVEISYETYKQHVKGSARDYYVALLYTQPEGSSCRMCPYYSKQYEDFVKSYKDQWKKGQTYAANKPIYFVKVIEDHTTQGVKRDLRLRTMPSFSILAPAGQKDVAVEYGRKQIEDVWSMRAKRALASVTDELKELGKKSSAAARAAARKDKRRRQVTTQEDMEYDSYGTRNFHEFKANNLCKFLKVNAGVELNTCPQDAPLDFQQKKKPQDLLKNVLVMIICGAAGVVICRIFGFYFDSFDVNEVDLRNLVHKKYCIALDGDEHNMAALRPEWVCLFPGKCIKQTTHPLPRHPILQHTRIHPQEIYGTYVLFGGWICVFSFLVAGSYYNILNGVPWGGGRGRSDQTGSESAMLALLYAIGITAMTLAGSAMSPHIGFLDFTRVKNAPYAMNAAARSNVIFYFAVGGVATWTFMFFLILRMFTQKGQGASYLWNSALGPLIFLIRGR